MVTPNTAWGQCESPLGRYAPSNGEFTLIADRAVFWSDSKTSWRLPENAEYPLEAYLEGNVKVSGNGPMGTLDAVYLNAPDGKFALERQGTFGSANLKSRANGIRQDAVTSSD